MKPPVWIALAGTLAVCCGPEPELLELRKGDCICLLGNGLAERMQHDGWLETRLQSRFPELGLTMRNLGFAGDELSVQQRTMNFGKFSYDQLMADVGSEPFAAWDRYLAHLGADVIFAFFGYNESFAGSEGLAKFRKDLENFVRHVSARKYNAESAPRLVLFSPIPHEDLRDPKLPNGREHNARLMLYTRAMADVAKKLNTPFVDLFTAMLERYKSAMQALTINGMHLNDTGNRVLAEVIDRALFAGGRSKPPAGRAGELRRAVLDKNLLWFNRYRVTDGYNVYGGRSRERYPRRKGTPDEARVSNFRVLQREMDVLDVMVQNRDRRIRALARGEELAVDDSNVPQLIEVRTDTPGEGPRGRHVFLSGAAAIQMMTAAKGMRVELYASERQFPELVNPVQMAWDTQGRLWVAAWPTYPHWKPGQPRNDKLLILEDQDADGRADACKVFAGDLQNPTGFEFWNGGVLVASAPDLLFLKDSDGDDVADTRERLLHGLSSADTHHSANSFVLGPGGALYFQEGTFHRSQIESIYGPVRNLGGCVWRFDPRSWLVERYVPYGFANPHGHVFDRWGQDFVTDGTGNVNYYALPFSGYVQHPEKHGRYFSFFRQRNRPAAATEILSSGHFPPANQGNYLIANVIGFRGIFQYRVRAAGSGFTAEEVEPIVSSTDENFRPVDIEVGPDGALYFLDWHNPLIGHLQHHIRDPSRDHSHGRVYRVRCEGRPLLERVRIAGRSIRELLELLKSSDDRLRYRVRIELSARDSARVVKAARAWAAGLDKHDPDYEHHLLEALWLQQQHARIDREILERLLRAEDHRARAAATRVLRYMRGLIDDPLALLRVQANDPHPRVRLEAVVGASFFDSAEAASVALEALRHPTDRFLDYALQETMKALAPRWKEALRNGRSIAAGNPPGIRYLLGRVGPEELVELPRVPEVLETMLSRPGMDRATRLDAARELARQKRTTLGEEILNAVRSLDRSGDPTHVLNELGPLLQEAVSGPEPPSREALATLARGGRSLAVRELGYASLVALDRSADRAWRACSKSRGALRAFLGGVSRIASPELRASLYPKIRPCMFALPAKLREAGVASGPSGLSVAYHRPAPADALLAALREREPEARLRASMFTLDLPGVSRAGSFGLLFRGRLLVPEKGKYRFFSESDDGSRIYIRGRCVVNNDGPHGMRERSAWVELDAGSHPISVTYFDQGGADGLEISWQGPGFDKEPIPAEVLTGDDAGSIRAAAISAMAHVPGNESQKFADAGRLLGEEGLLEPAVALLRSIPKARWPRPGIRPVIETIAARVSGLPAEQRTEPDVVLALEAGHELARELSAEEAGSFGKQLEGLGGSIILIRTVPHRMLYDVTEFWVKTGEPVAIVLQNNDMMPHNLVITRAGAMARVGRAAEHLSGRGGQRDFIPRSNDVLWHTALLYPGQTERLAFVAPEASGDRPFVCTFPGHWRVMNGVMHVVDELEQGMRVARRSSEGGSAPPREFVKQWTLADLQAALAPGWEAGRSLPRGQRLFAEAGCKKCHSFNGAGLKSGPDLSEIGKKYAARDLLRQILEPSAEILEGFVYHEIQLERGGDVFGRVVKDDGESLHVVQTLQNPDDVTVIPKSAIESMEKSDLSAMPTGLLVTLTREEILDLLAWLRAGRFSDNK